MKEPEAMAGRKKASSSRPASFLTRSREHYTSERGLLGVYGTSRERGRWNGEGLGKQQGHGKNWSLE